MRDISQKQELGSALNDLKAAEKFKRSKAFPAAQSDSTDLTLQTAQLVRECLLAVLTASMVSDCIGLMNLVSFRNFWKILNCLVPEL